MLANDNFQPDLALVLDRSAGGQPRIDVITGRYDGETTPANWRRVTFSVRVSQTAWRRLMAQASDALDAWREAQSATPTLPTEICLDVGFTTFELASEGKVQRAVEAVCPFDAVFGKLAVAMGGEALKRLPACREISKNADGVFEACAKIVGRRRAATGAYNAFVDSKSVDLRDWIASNATADWQGLPHAAGRAAVRALLATAYDQLDAGFSLGVVRGGAPDRVLMVGGMDYRNVDEADGPRLHGPCTLTWAKVAGRWRIVRIEAGPFSPLARAAPQYLRLPG